MLTRNSVRREVLLPRMVSHRLCLANSNEEEGVTEGLWGLDGGAAQTNTLAGHHPVAQAKDGGWARDPKAQGSTVDARARAAGWSLASTGTAMQRGLPRTTLKTQATITTACRTNTHPSNSNPGSWDEFSLPARP